MRKSKLSESDRAFLVEYNATELWSRLNSKFELINNDLARHNAEHTAILSLLQEMNLRMGHIEAQLTSE